MMQDPNHPAGLDPGKIAELEHKLAEAAAEVAKVRAQLTQAQGTGGTPPAATSTAAPGTTIPQVPYGGTGPHEILIDGQPVVPGSGNLASVLQSLAAAGAAGTATAPVVVVNGQNVSSGQPLDLSAYLDPQVAQQLQTSLHQLGLDGRLGTLFGNAAPAAPTEPV